MKFLVVLLLVCLAFNAEAKIYAWGVNDYGQLGNDNTSIRLPQPIPAYNDLNIVDLKASGTYHIAFAGNGDVYVSGNDWYGALGMGQDDTEFIYFPVKNDNLRGCKVFVGKRHANAICGTHFYGWGVLAGFVKGYTKGTYPSPSQSLEKYGFTSGNVVDVMAGGYMTYVTLQNGSIYVAGYGTHGALGLGGVADHYSFDKFNSVFDGVPILKLCPSHANHNCAILQNYSLVCWGDNELGQLGLGTTVDRWSPTLVDFFERHYYVAQVTVGLQHTLALTAGGRVFSWGFAQNGALGNNVKGNVTFPTPVEIEFLADKNIVEIVSGLNFNFARTGDNQWYSWGAGSGGVLGTVSDADVAFPTLVKSFQGFSINHVLTASTSRSVYAWFDPDAPTTIPGPPLVNECLQNFVCGTNAHCKDTDKSAMCVCDKGYSGDGTTCSDINECTLTVSVCVAGATCQNTDGDYNCTCPAGKEGDGKKSGSGCNTIGGVQSTGATSNSGTTQTTGNGNGGTSGGGNGGTTRNGNGGTSGGGNGGTSGGGNGGTSGGGNGGTSGGGNGGTSGGGNGGTTSGGDGNGGNGNGASTTTYRPGQYQSLGGVHDASDESSLEVDPPIKTSGTSSSNDKDRDTMIAVLVVFGFLILVALAIIAIVFYKNKKRRI